MLMSRVNHHCVGNCTHCYFPEMRVKALIASRDIAPGEEISFAYKVMRSGQDASHLCAELKLTFGFDCACGACTDPVISGKLAMIPRLDDRILRLVQQGSVGAALETGEALIKLYDELKLSPLTYGRTYYDMFQVCFGHEEA